MRLTLDGKSRLIVQQIVEQLLMAEAISGVSKELKV